MLSFSARAHKSQPGHYISSCSLLLLLSFFHNAVCGRSLLNLLSICPQLFVFALGGHAVCSLRLCSNTPPKHTQSQGGFPCWPGVSGLYYEGDRWTLKRTGPLRITQTAYPPLWKLHFLGSTDSETKKSLCCCFQNVLIIEFFSCLFFFLSPKSLSLSCFPTCLQMQRRTDKKNSWLLCIVEKLPIYNRWWSVKLPKCLLLVP